MKLILFQPIGSFFIRPPPTLASNNDFLTSAKRQNWQNSTFNIQKPLPPRLEALISGKNFFSCIYICDTSVSGRRRPNWSETHYKEMKTPSTLISGPLSETKQSSLDKRCRQWSRQFPHLLHQSGVTLLGKPS